MSTQPHEFASEVRARKQLPDVDEATLEVLLGRIAQRDAAAFAALYERTVARVYAVALCIVRNRADAEDVVCDVFERAWTIASSYQSARGDALAWLNAICRNRAIDTVRQRDLRKRRRSDGQGNGAAGDTHEASLEPHHFEPGGAIARALTGLPPLRRQIIALSFCRGLSHREIASELSMPLGTVKSHLRRAIADLRGMLSARKTGEP